MTTWLYYHARWLYKFLSSYAYEMNCEIEETCAALRRQIKAMEKQQKINEIIALKKYKEADNPNGESSR